MWPKLNALLRLPLGDHRRHQDTVFDYADIAMFAADYFIKAYPERIQARYQLSELPETEIELLELIARQRGFMRKGGLADLHKASEILVNEFRSGLLGRISLETPAMVSVEIVEAEAEAEQKAREEGRAGRGASGTGASQVRQSVSANQHCVWYSRRGDPGVASSF